MIHYTLAILLQESSLNFFSATVKAAFTRSLAYEEAKVCEKAAAVAKLHDLVRSPSKNCFVLFRLLQHLVIMVQGLQLGYLTLR